MASDSSIILDCRDSHYFPLDSGSKKGLSCGRKWVAALCFGTGFLAIAFSIAAIVAKGAFFVGVCTAMGTPGLVVIGLVGVGLVAIAILILLKGRKPLEHSNDEASLDLRLRAAEQRKTAFTKMTADKANGIFKKHHKEGLLHSLGNSIDSRGNSLLQALFPKRRKKVQTMENREVHSVERYDHEAIYESSED